MEHIEFFRTFRTIREHIVGELIDALKAHGGEYAWKKNEGPIVSINHWNKSEDVMVVTLHVADGNVEIQADSCEDGCPMLVSIDDIFIEHLWRLTDSIPICLQNQNVK